ncbi:6-phospho-3-hexuloisomerase [Candidatus Methylocalor cossyra]|uniref:3-hexulose-6-phosphate isomerase n=1 Tax=Candidatus Methylocalor cossyra TaxID=3108543 RepID=A0ABP1C8V9_9GAMM
MHQQRIIDTITRLLAATDPGYDAQLTRLLDQAGRIFVAGAGRSGLIARFFAMRLMHGGYTVFVVGEIVTPSLRPGDLLLVISGSGETETMVAFARRAKELRAQVALLTARDRSTLAELADQVFRIGTPELYGKVVGLPLGTTFELAALFFLEATIAHIIHEKGIPEEAMRTRHANLE